MKSTWRIMKDILNSIKKKNNYPEAFWINVMGDLNASIGSDRIAHRGIIGPVCSGFAKDNGSCLLDFCASNDLRIGSSWFPRKRIHELNWYSNDGVARKSP